MVSSLRGWVRVVDSLDALLTRVACLESVLEGATFEGKLYTINYY